MPKNANRDYYGAYGDDEPAVNLEYEAWVDEYYAADPNLDDEEDEL